MLQLAVDAKSYQLLQNHLLYVPSDSSDPWLRVHSLYANQTTSTGLFAHDFRGKVGGSRAVFLVDEVQVDLNNDGDLADTLLYSFDSTTGLIAPTLIEPIDPYQMMVDGARVSLEIHESAPPMDWNNDGDQTDRIPMILDLATGTTQVASVAGYPFLTPWLFENGTLSFPSVESHGGKDLNGDGDILDIVPSLLDAATGAVTHAPAIYGSGWFRLGPSFAWKASLEAGIDRNGDGDGDDTVVLVFDPATQATQSIPVAAHFAATVGSRIVVLADEAENGHTDLNGDGDATDPFVALCYDPQASVLYGEGLAVEKELLLADGDYLVVQVDEAGQGNVDRNNDGDTDDQVVALIHAPTGEVTSLGIAAELSPSGWIGDVANFKMSDGVLTFLGSEAQDSVDRNLDGDLADEFPVVHHIETNATVVLPYHAWNRVGTVDGLMISNRMENTGAVKTDLNADGDTKDRVYQMFDFETGEVTNLSLAQPWSFWGTDIFGYIFAQPVQSSRKWLAAAVNESQQGQDLDNDGALTSSLTFLLRLPEPTCGAVYPYGSGCAGAQQITPDIAISGCPKVGSGISIAVGNALGGSVAALFAGSSRADQTEGCGWLLDGIYPIPLMVPLGGSGPGQGFASIPAVLPPSALSSSFTVQWFVADGVAVTGVSSSAAVQVVVP